MRRWSIGMVVVLSVCATPSLAHAGGYGYPENGAKALAQGGAFTADPTDGTALYFNPAGLADLTGTRVLLDGHFVFMNTTFQRFDATGQPIGDAVHNGYNPWIAPFLAVSHQLFKGLTLAAGLYGPSAFGAQSYPDPRKIEPTLFDGNPNNDPTDTSAITQQAPQRYMLIDSSILVLYPSLAVGWAPTKWLSIGGTAQVAVGSTAFSQAIYAGVLPGEDPANDGIASLSVTSKPVFTGILGIQARPTDGVVFGASWRPGFTIEGDGTLDVTLSDPLQSLLSSLGGKLEGNSATLTTKFPTVWRFGAAAYKGGWEGAFDVVYTEWSAVHALVVKPDITLTLAGGSQKLPDIVIPKNWNDTVSVRIGGRLDLKKQYHIAVPLTIRAGYTFTSSAIPPSTLGIDFIDGLRNQVSAGVTYDLGFLGITLTASHIFQAQQTVRGSQVRQQVSPPPPPLGHPYQGSIIGNGTYDANITNLVLGLEGKFGA